MDNSTSGYTDSIDGEMVGSDALHLQEAFADLQEMYVSPAGHARLFTATRYGKRYVLKCLKPDFMYIPVYRQALAKEFEIGLQLDHPCICRTIGMEDVEGLGKAIVMEHIDGATLKNFIDNKTITPALARKVTEQLTDALDYIHSKQIFHRDLKPANVMLTHNGHNVKLIDFSLSDSDAYSVLKIPAGTSGYIAPEQMVSGAKANAEADVYSLGVMMDEMADACGDKQLKRMAEACTRRDPMKRPTTKAQIMASPKATITQRVVVALLLLLSLTLASYIGVTIYQRATTPITIEDDGNRVMDFQKKDVSLSPL